MTPTARLTRAAAALLALLTLTLAVPVGLWKATGWPLPHHAPTLTGVGRALTQPLQDQFLLNTLACLCWTAWAVLIAGLVTESTRLATGALPRRLPVLGPAQLLAANLLGALLFGLTPAHASNPPDGQPLHTALRPATPAAIGPTTASTPLTSGPSNAQSPAALARPAAALNTLAGQPDSQQVQQPPRLYRVQPRDSLWRIAERQLGDPLRWRQIWQLNRGRPQPDGQRLHNPDLIQPGWILALPPQPTTVSPPSKSPSNAAPTAPPLTPPTTPESPAETPPQTPRPSSAGPTHPAGATVHPPQTPATPQPPASSTRRSAPQRPPAPPPRPAVTQPAPGAPTRPSPGAGRPSSPAARQPSEVPNRPAPATPLHHLPTGGLVGLGLASAVGAALVLARLHARRRYRPGDPTRPRQQTHWGTTVAILRRMHLTKPKPASVTSPAADTPGTEPATTQLLATASTGGLGVTGTTADAAIRAVLIHLLSQDEHTTAVVIPAADLTELLGQTPAVSLANLTITDTPEQAVTALELHLLARTRLCEDNEAATAAELRTRDPGEPMPLTVLVASPNPDLDPRVHAVVQQGNRYALAAIIRGSLHHGATVDLDDNGTVQHLGDANNAALAGTQLEQLTPAEAVEILTLLTEAHPTDPVVIEATTSAEPVATEVQPAMPADLSATQDTQPAPNPSPSPAAEDREDHGDHGEGEHHPSAMARLRVFGPPGWSVADQPLSGTLRSKAVELSTYLALHLEGATSGSLADLLWPDTAPDKAAKQLSVVLANLRGRLREATHRPETTFIIHHHGRYHLDRARIDTDLWEFQRTLAAAARTDEPQRRQQLLTQAADLYQGEFAADTDWAWAEGPREMLRSQALDTLDLLAQCLQEDGRHHQALHVYRRAINIDPYTESLYQQTMAIYAHLNQPEAVRRTLHQLQAALTDIDAEPSASTRQLASQLLHGQQRPHPGAA